MVDTLVGYKATKSPVGSLSKAIRISCGYNFSRMTGKMKKLFRPRVLIIGIFCLALILRLIFINTKPLWYDEAFAVLFAGKGPAAIIYGTLTPVGGAAADVHPLAYYLSLWGWMAIFGNAPASVRALSVFYGLGLVLVSYFLAKELFGDRTALISALLVAASPFQIHYAQEIRMYALMAFALGLATVSMWKGLNSNGWGWWIVFALSAALAQFTHNLAAIYLIPLALTPLLFRKWRQIPVVGASATLALILYSPWLWNLASQLKKISTNYWTETPGLDHLFTTLLSYTTNLPLPGLWLPIGLFITLSLFSTGLWQTIKAARVGDEFDPRGVWLLYLSLTPVLLLLAISQLQPVFIERALLFSGVMYVLWIGWALLRPGVQTPVRIVSLALIVIGFGMGIYQNYTYRGFPYADYSKLAQSLEERLQPGDVVVHSNKLSMLPMVYYDPSIPQEYIGDTPESGSDTLALPTQEVLGLYANDSLDEAVNGSGRVWFVIFERAIDEYTQQGFSGHPHLIWLEKHFQSSHIERWGDLLLYRFD
jgi:hypothetical protein